MKKYRVALLCVLLSAGNCSWADSADYVFTGGTIYTMDEAQPSAEAIAITGNKIVYVGDAAGATELVGSGTREIDMKGRVMLPGFVSAHDHLIASNWTTMGVNLFDARSGDEALEMIKNYAEAHPDEKVIRGVGWSRETFGGELPDAKLLDTVVPDRPAILLDFTIHDAWLNTAALKAGNIDKDSPDALPGVTYWVRDNAGNPTGIAIELQWMGTYIKSGAWDPEKMIPESAEKLFAIAAQHGTTTFLNPGVVTPNIKDTHGGMEDDFRNTMKYLHSLETQGKLPMRSVVLPMFKNNKADPKRFVAFAKAMNEQYNSDMLTVHSVKVHPEGNLVAEVAPTLEPYENNSENRGTFNVPPELTKAIVLEANKVGLDVMIHTDGDRSSRAAIDAIEAAFEAGYKDNRNALHHLIWVHPDDQQRIIDMKIPVNSTPHFSNDWQGSDKQFLELMGESRVNSSLGRYPELARAGVNVSISADVPSTMPHMQGPLFIVQSAVTVKDPLNPQSKPFPPNMKGMSIEQAFRAVTIDAAWQLRMEDKIGSLTVGKYADLVVLDENPLDVAPEEIAEIDVLMTMMDGRITHMVERDRYLTPAELGYVPQPLNDGDKMARATSPDQRMLMAQAAFFHTFVCKHETHAARDHAHLLTH